jgi:hypothetical protein
MAPRRSVREHVSRLVRGLIPYGVDVGIGALYEAADWSDEALAALISVGTGGTGAVPAQVVEEGIDNALITVTNRVYKIAGDLYEKLGIMTPEERRSRDRVLKIASYTERAQLGPLDVVPAYVAAAAGYHGINAINDAREAMRDLGEWLKESVYDLKKLGKTRPRTSLSQA